MAVCPYVFGWLASLTRLRHAEIHHDTSCRSALVRSSICNAKVNMDSSHACPPDNSALPLRSIFLRADLTSSRIQSILTD